MSNEQSPNEDHIGRVSESGELVGPNTSQQVQEEEETSVNDLPGEGLNKSETDAASSDNITTEEELSHSLGRQQREEEVVAEEDKQDHQGPQTTDLDTVKQQQITSTMSPEQVLLLQLLRRAKRQQELVIEVQKNLKPLATIQKRIDKMAEQVNSCNPHLGILKGRLYECNARSNLWSEHKKSNSKS